MEKLLDQIKAVAEEADEQTRRAITESLRRLSISLEDSEDTVERIAFAVSNYTLLTQRLPIN
jgi:O-acetylhomoserine/O-acetylserine sulfhydrylase-like pyridoxal-dependent enzyme